MERTSKHDDILMDVLRNEGDVVSFVDTIFGFLYRRTDFFHLNDQNARKIGFPAGVARKVTLQVFDRYERQSRYDEQMTALNNVATCDVDVPAAVEEVHIPSGIVSSPPPRTTPVKANRRGPTSDECYNGADRGRYRWSQTLADVDVRCDVSAGVCRAKQLRVFIESQHLRIQVRDGETWTTMLDKSLPHKVNRKESVWSLIPGDHIHMSLEKAEERWWDRLFTCDPPIDTRAIDTTTEPSNLHPADQMKFEELLLNEQRRARNCQKWQEVQPPNPAETTKVEAVTAESQAIDQTDQENPSD